jgi:hypothetical protein
LHSGHGVTIDGSQIQARVLAENASVAKPSSAIVKAAGELLQSLRTNLIFRSPTLRQNGRPESITAVTVARTPTASGAFPRPAFGSADLQKRWVSWKRVSASAAGSC